jgi:hypothetical protein
MKSAEVFLMKEETVYWVGTQPLPDNKTASIADDESFVAAIRCACESAGCQVRQFVSALGPFGTWLVEIEHHGEEKRILWNGKEERLILQVKLSQGGWEDPMAIAVATKTLDGFVDGVNAILSVIADNDA